MVRFIAGGYYLTMTKGKEYTVTSVFNYSSGNQSVSALNDAGNEAGWPCRFFELVTPEPKFKVGDTVRFKTGSAKGQDYEVSDAREQEIRLWVSDTHNGQTSWFPNTELELVTPKPEPKADPTYTVTWKAPVRNGYKSIVDGELSFGTKDEARGFASLFYPEVITTVTEN